MSEFLTKPKGVQTQLGKVRQNWELEERREREKKKPAIISTTKIVAKTMALKSDKAGTQTEYLNSSALHGR